MAEEQIDISLSLLDQRSGVVFQDFIRAVQSLRESVDAMHASSGRATAEANRKVSTSFDRTVQPGQPNPRASRSDSTKFSDALRDSSAHIRESLAPEDRDFFDEAGPYNINPVSLLRDRDFSVGTRLRMATATGATGAASRIDTAWNNPWIQMGRGLAHNGANLYFGGQAAVAAVRNLGGILPAPTRTGAGHFYSAEGADVGPFRMPLFASKEAGWHGTTEWLREWEQGAMMPGVSHKDVHNINEFLYEQGYRDDIKSRDAMSNAMLAMKQRYPDIDTNLSGTLMVQAVRDGQGNLDEFVRTMKKDLPDAVKFAGTNVNQFMESMLEVSEEMSKTMGVTRQQGQKWAIDYHAITGNDPRVGLALQKNGFVQARTMAMTGLLPQAQGLLPAGVTANIQSQSVEEMVRMFSGMGDRTIHGKGGINYTVTGHDQAVGMAAERMGLSVNQVKKMLQDTKRQRAMGSLQTAAESMRTEAQRMANRDRDPSDIAALATGGSDDGGRGTSWRSFDRLLHQQQRQHVIKAEDVKKIEGAGKDKFAQAAKEGDPEKARKLYMEGVNERYEKAKDVYTKSGQKHEANLAKQKVEITFTDEAKKLLKVKKTSPVDIAKEAAQAGATPLLHPSTITHAGLSAAESAASSIFHSVL
jgi:hypothetical protein